MQRIFSMELAGRTITAETGKYAEQAGGIVHGLVAQVPVVVLQGVHDVHGGLAGIVHGSGEAAQFGFEFWRQGRHGLSSLRGWRRRVLAWAGAALPDTVSGTGRSGVL